MDDDLSLYWCWFFVLHFDLSIVLGELTLNASQPTQPPTDLARNGRCQVSLVRRLVEVKADPSAPDPRYGSTAPWLGWGGPTCDKVWVKAAGIMEIVPPTWKETIILEIHRRKGKLYMYDSSVQKRMRCKRFGRWISMLLCWWDGSYSSFTGVIHTP